jgi:SpoIID/LytB domain protein
VLRRATLLVCLLGAASAHADGLDAQSRLALLDSSLFSFTADGVPLHRIRVLEGVREVVVESDDGLVLCPDGPGRGTEVSGLSRVTVRLVRGEPARVRYWAVAARGAPSDAAAMEAEAKRRRASGHDARVFEVGTLFSIAGETVDRRRLLLGVGPWDGEDAAIAAAKALGLDGAVHPERVERQHGLIEAVLEGTPVRVRQPDVLWISPKGETLRAAGAAYAGDLYVAVDRHGTLAVVNAVPEDRLLAGLVPAEIYPSAPMEALKAQAVAARTDLLAKIGDRHLADPYLFCNEQHCQVYKGAGHEHPRTTEAVRATRGEVLLSDGRLVDAVYSAVCGGHTEHNDHVWPGPADPALRGRPDSAARDAPAPGDEAALRQFVTTRPEAWCARANGKFRWERRLDAGALGAELDIGRLSRIEVLTRGVSGRATSVRLVGTAGRREVDGELRIRRALGGLPSAMFVADGDGGSIVLRGGGWGHGVGLCQIGAIGMAEAGRDYARILGHYYRGAKLRRLY